MLAGETQDIKAWRPRLLDLPSSYIPLATAVVASLAAGAIQALQRSSGGETSFLLEMSLEVAKWLIPFAGFSLVLACVMTLLRSRIVEEHHVARIYCWGVPTGEYARSGWLRLPLSYSCEVYSAQVTVLDTGSVACQSKDSFGIVANLRADVALINPGAANRLKTDTDTLNTRLRDSLSSAMASCLALRMMQDLSEITEKALAEVKGRLERFGYEVENVSVKIESFPDELNQLRGYAAQINAMHPTAQPAEIFDFILEYTGRRSGTVGQIKEGLLQAASMFFAQKYGAATRPHRPPGLDRINNP